jgi:hypothetical protein
MDELSKQTWRPFFDRVSKSLVGKRAEVEIASLNLGDQVAVDWLPLIGISYDPKDDVLDVALEGFDHLINAPRRLRVQRDNGQLKAIEVVDDEQIHHIVKLKDPLALPGEQK